MSVAHRVLLVADRNADAPELIAALPSCREGARVTLLVPAYATEFLAADGGGAADWGPAMDRAERCARRLRRAGVELEETIVGDPDPAAAIGDALHARRFDQVIAADGGRLRTSREPAVAAA